MISDMYLDIGGVCYPAAPFNGWYMCTEIGSRDLGDAGRYDQLPVIARHMGLSTASDRTLWKDKAMTELNLAVLHSFSAAGVTISDHHTESVRFLQHMEREERQGRACPADWTWIVPLLPHRPRPRSFTATTTTPTRHRTSTGTPASGRPVWVSRRVAESHGQCRTGVGSDIGAETPCPRRRDLAARPDSCQGGGAYVPPGGHGVFLRMAAGERRQHIHTRASRADGGLRPTPGPV